MSVSSTTEEKDTATTSRTRSQKSAKTKEEKSMPVDSVETKDNEDTNKGSQMIPLSSQGGSDAKAIVPLPSDRPTGTSHLQISQTFMSAGIRPIESSHLKFTETNNTGIRPVGSSSLTIVDTMQFSGIRPVTASTLKITETLLNFGARPVASNDIDAGQDIMGFLD